MTQAQALDILKTGANVFLTGEPGSGKTHTVNAYTAYLRSCGIEPSITASTGIAATHVDGMTIHAWSGIGVKKRIAEEDLDEMAQRERLVKRLCEASVLIIDEISMLAVDTLDSVEAVCRHLRGKDMPFGGLQVIFVGDFFQLPPVIKNDWSEGVDYDEDARTPFAFRSRAWREANPIVCYLSEQHRQQDIEYLEVLTEVRSGRVTQIAHTRLSARQIPPPSDGITQLFPHNANVDRLNQKELEKIPGKSWVFTMRSSGASALVEALKRNCLSPEVLTLKAGAKVMFTKNSIDGAYVNGTLGDVVGVSVSGYPVIRTMSGREIDTEPQEWAIADGSRVLAKIVQVPLRLAWAITVHKSQGLSLERAAIDLSAAFEYGQGYVALSRVRSLSGLYLSGFNTRALEVHPEVSEFDESLRESSEAAADAFSSMTKEELSALQANFLKAVGGVPGSGRKEKQKKESTFAVTRELVLKGLSVEAIAKARGVTEGTVITHLEKLVLLGELDPHEHLAHMRPERLEKIRAAFEKTAEDGKFLLSPAKSKLDASYEFEELRLARLFL
jgi:ATP-dependent DNA helicase PIF1